jgi:holo-[acyl-carrier protein] synthase
MPILRTGVDIIEIDRFTAACRNYKERMLGRLFTDTELKENGAKMSSLAARFAAKEAVAKALGTGIGPVTWHEIEICRGKAGEPVLCLHGSARSLADQLKLTTWSLSLSHTQTQAIAFVVAIGDETQ